MIKESGTITGIVHKKRRDSLVGISFRQKGKCVVIHKVQGMFKEKTNLVPGLKLLQVNGVSVETSHQAALLIQTCVGEVSVVADGYCVTSKKHRRQEKVGISLQQQCHGAAQLILRIARVDPKGLFPSLRAGQILLSVNQRPVSTIQDAIQLLMEQRKLTLIVVDEPSEVSSSTPTTSVTDELEFMEEVDWKMQDEDDDDDYKEDDTDDDDL
jgi:hypothetical protein